MSNNKKSINEIMHGLSNAGSVNADELYFNDVKFPSLDELEKASLLLVRKLKSFDIEGNSITFQTEGHFFQKGFTYRYFDYRPVYDQIDGARNICVKLTLCKNDIIRIRAKEGFEVPENKTEMVVNDFSEPVEFEIKDEENFIQIITQSITVTINKDPWNVSIKNKEGKTFYKQFGEDTSTYMKFESCPFGFLYDLTNDEKYACEMISFKDDEHFYGLGEQFTKLDKKGQDITLWNTNALSVCTERAYKNIPFFISSKGYGMYINTANKSYCNMGEKTNKAYSIMSDGSLIDYYIIYGPTIKEILPKYTDITGKPHIPPKWSFGLWMSKISYSTRDEVEAVAKRFRDEEIPCDVIHIDTDWFEENWICNFKFSETKFPKVEEMLSQLKEQGYRVSIWQLPYLEKGSAEYDVYDEGLEKGYFAVNPEGTKRFPHGLIDFSNPEAVDWYKNKLLKPLLDKGVSAIKVDFGESAPPFFNYSQHSGEEMHNLYSLLYNKAAFEATEEVKGKDEAFIWARSAWAGSQRYPVHWGGDSGTDFASLTASIKAGLSFGLSGFPFWSHDIGGFFYETNPTLYARWAQVGLFSSHSRTHGFYTREPWDFGEEVKEIFKYYTQLRYKLMPYIYSSSVKCANNSLPMFKALVIEYQDDPTVSNIDNQYLFGDYFLVAPILDEGRERMIYLPEGKWTDYWDKKQYEGRKWIKYQADLDKLPLFVRANAIIPMGPVMNYIDEKECDPITLDLYPVNNGTEYFEIIDNDKSLIHIGMCKDENKININISQCNHNFELVINNVSKETNLIINNKNITISEIENSQCYFENKTIYAKINHL